MQAQSNQKVWIIIGIILGVILILLIGLVIGKILTDGGPTAPTSDESRNPPATGAVAIQSFTLEPGRIQAGECTNLSWLVTNAEIVTLSRDGEVIYNALMDDRYQDCLSQAGVYRYRLDASNSDGQFYNWSELQVIVE